MFESRISSGAKEKLLARASGKPDAETISSWPYDMEGHAEKCVERCCELANKTTQQLFQVKRHAWMTINLKKRKKSQENCLQSGHKLFSNVCIWLVVRGPDFLRSVKKLARALTKWTKACDKRLAAFDLAHSSHN